MEQSIINLSVENDITLSKNSNNSLDTYSKSNQHIYGMVYGFKEKNKEKNMITNDFLKKYKIKRFALYSHSNNFHGFIYGVQCKNIIHCSDNEFIHNTKLVQNAYNAVSNSFEYDIPTSRLAMMID
jgi:hypothetical protein